MICYYNALQFVPQAVSQSMCQHIVFGMDCGTRKLDIVSDTGVLGKKSLFYGQIESYFAGYDNVVLTGPISASGGICSGFAAMASPVYWINGPCRIAAGNHRSKPMCLSLSSSRLSAWRSRTPS